MRSTVLTPRSDGRFCACMDERCFYSKTQKEALATRDAYKRALESGQRSELRGLTVDAYAARWLPVAKSGVDDATYNDYARMLNAFFARFVGVPLTKVLPSDVSAALASLSGKSKSYISKYVQLVRALFASAVDDGVLLRSPFTKSVFVPDGSAGSHRALKDQEHSLVVSSVGLHSFAPAAMLMMFSGLKRGEMLALNVSRDIDFARGIIHVREAVKFVNNQPVPTDPKTEAGVRDIQLFAPLRAVLLPIPGLVLTCQSGSHLSEIGLRKRFASNLLTLEQLANGGRVRRWYGSTRADHALLASGGSLPPWQSVSIQLHDFRHTFATILWETGVDVKTAIKWMGHSDESMLLRVYAHLTDRREQAAALSMAQSLAIFDSPALPACLPAK